MSDDVTKLPKWAQQRIGKLELDIAYYKEMAYQAANTDVTDTSVRVVGGRGWEFLGLLTGSTVRFAGIEVRALGPGAVITTADGNNLEIHPRGSNCIHVRGDVDYRPAGLLGDST